MAALSYQIMDFAGTTPSYAAASGGGDTITPDDVGFLHVKNGGGGAITVTLSVAGTTFGQPNADDAVSVAAGDSKMIGPLVSDFVGTDTFGVVLIAYSGVTSVTVAAFRHPGQQPSLP